MTTVACVFVRGHVAYAPHYVFRLRSMVRRYLEREHRFVCLTDQPSQLRGIDRVVVPHIRPLKGWWSKLELFNPKRGLAGRVLYLDLDTLVVGSLEAFLDYPAPFALLPHKGSFRPLTHRVVHRFNSSVMVWDAGDPLMTALWTAWQPSVARRLWGDQDWIGEQAPAAATFPASWCPRLSEVSGPPFGEAKVILAKVPKNDEAAQAYRWFREAWT